MSPYTIGIFCQTNFSQEAIRLTAGDGGPSAGCQTIQTQLSRCYVKIKHKNNIIYSAPPQKVAGL